jgi:hypothetical protein
MLKMLEQMDLQMMLCVEVAVCKNVDISNRLTAK